MSLASFFLFSYFGRSVSFLFCTDFRVLFFLVPWRMSLICLYGLHWVCRQLWITYTFNDIKSSNMEYPLPISDIFNCLNHHFLVFGIQCLPSWVINTLQYFWCCYKRAAFLTSFPDITLLIFGNTAVVGWPHVLPLYQVRLSVPAVRWWTLWASLGLKSSGHETCLFSYLMTVISISRLVIVARTKHPDE